MRRLSLVVLLTLIAVGSVTVIVRAQFGHEQQRAPTSAREAVESTAAPETPRDRVPPALERPQEVSVPRPRRAEARTGEVAFEDGTRITITMRPVHLTPPPFVAPKRLVARYAELVRVARE